jgi:hypothetical protein
MRFAILGFFAAFAAGCGGSIATVDSSDVADASVDAAWSAPDAAATVAVAHCPWERGGPDGGVIPYDKKCTATSDCAIGMHLNNCCGEEIALGVNVDDVARFRRDGGICGDEYGGPCDCAMGGTVAEDGQTSRQPMGTDIVVACVAGECLTHVAR